MADTKTDLAAGLAALAEDELKALLVAHKQASIECVSPAPPPSPGCHSSQPDLVPSAQAI
jgi:hypothetical protein